MRSVVVSTPDTVGARMAGPGIRAFRLAAELNRHFPTTLLAHFTDTASLGIDFEHHERGSRAARQLLDEADVVIGQPTRDLLALSRKKRKKVFDFFDPVVLELQELYRDGATLRQRLHLRREWSRLRSGLAEGDLLIAGWSHQRDFYSHLWTSPARPADWAERWIDIPFGIDEVPDEEVPEDEPPRILWGGGRWGWLDPVGAIDAVQLANDHGVRCRLFFLGGRHPNADAAVAATADEEIRRRAEAAPDVVIENQGWVPYRERWRWLRGSSVAIMLHRQTPEAEFSLRTRLFDAIWSALPVVASEGGFAAELVAREGLGVVVPCGDATAAAAAIERLLTEDGFRAGCVSRLEALRPRYAWSKVAQPLVEAVRRWL